MAIDRSVSSSALGTVPPEEEEVATRQQRSNTDASKSPASHFLTTMLSAAQNAASQLTGVPKLEQQLPEEGSSGSEDGPVEDEKAFPSVSDVRIEPIRSTISTLGQGELSLEALGLGPEKAASVASEEGLQPVVAEEPRRRSALAVPERSEFTQGGTAAVPVMSRSKSRASSLISRHRSRRRRSDESAGAPPQEGNTTAASSAAQLSNHTAPHGVRRNTGSSSPDAVGGDEGGVARGGRHLTGFAYANKKRNKDFHRLFRSVTPDDYLLDDFSCALSKDILIQGRLYVSERHVCFNSNILGWVTNLVIGFDEIVTLEKKNTAGLFPNGIVIQTLHARHSFASFVARDSAIEFLTSVWKQSSPHQMRAALNASAEALAAELDDSDQDSAVLDDESGSEVESDDSGSLDGEDEEYDEDLEYDGESLESFGSSSDELDSEEETTKADQKADKVDEKSDTTTTPPSSAPTATNENGGAGGEENEWPVPNLGPPTHAPTDTGTNPEKDGEKPLASEIIPAPLGVVANILFGSDTTWMKRFITENQKNLDLSDLPAFAKSDEGKRTRNYQYVKPLNGPVGPKQTRCICTDTIEAWKFDEKIIAVTSTATPDVPSGSSFLTKTRYALCWAPNNQTKLILSYWMDWSGKSWLKGAIERGSQDGQMQFAKDLVAELNSTLSTGGAKAARKPSKKPTKAKKQQRKKKKAAVAEPAQVAAQGPLEWVTSALAASIPGVPVPLWSILLFGVVAYAFLFSGRGKTVHSPSYTQQEYDRLSQMMLEEEYEVWKWIENRVVAADDHRQDEDIAKAYGRQELEESIRITEDRLNLLKQKLDF